MQEQQKPQRILITGAGRGIGKKLCDYYRDRNEEVIGMTRSECDIRYWEEVAQYCARTEVDNLDAIIHCAAINVTRFFHKTEFETFKDMVDVNIIGTFNLLRCAAPKLKSGGSIIIFSSVAAFTPRIGQSAYACCKSSLHGLVKVVMQELLQERKYIYLIAPGVVEEGMPFDMMSDLALRKATEMIPMKRFCEIREIINTIDFLRATPYLTGQTLHLNGGLFIP